MANKEEKDIVQPSRLSKTVFESDATLTIPTRDIISFAFERLDEFDPDKVIFAEAGSPEKQILAGDLKSRVLSLCAGLRANGLEAGDCVCLHSFNSIEYPLLWLAVIAAGGIVTGSNPAYTSVELTHHFKTTNTKFVVAQAKCLAAVKEAVFECGVSKKRVFVLGESISDHDFSPFEELAEPTFCNGSVAAYKFNKAQDDSVAVYASTSGTTGLPKAAELGHRYVVAQATVFEHVFSTRTKEVRQLICLPIFHMFAAQLAIIIPLRLGVTTYFMPRFDLAKYTQYVHRFHITDTPVVPPIVSALLNAPLGSLNSLRYVICAGAPMTASVQTKLYTKLHPNATISQCWGTTELGWISLFNHMQRDCSGSVGYLLPNTTLKLVDEFGNSITKDHMPGEARIKSSSMFRCYRNNPLANAGALDEEGFYCTGDRVYMDRGRLFIAGRIKDTMKVNGWQVSPVEIEHEILNIEGVVDCAVIGHIVINSKTSLEETRPRAFVVRKQGSNLSELDIQIHVANRLVRYKRLTGGVIFVDAIPRSNTGKILRRKMLEPDFNSAARLNLSNGHEKVDSHDLTIKVNFNFWTHYIVIMILMPMCFAMGVPGLILLCVGLKQVFRGECDRV